MMMNIGHELRHQQKISSLGRDRTSIVEGWGWNIVSKPRRQRSNICDIGYGQNSGHDVLENIFETKKIFQDDGQRFKLGSLGKSGQGLARQGLLGGMRWSWWSRQINLHAMRPKTHKWLPSWSQDDVWGNCGTATRIFTRQGAQVGGMGHIMPRHDIWQILFAWQRFGWGWSYHAQTWYNLHSTHGCGTRV